MRLDALLQWLDDVLASHGIHLGVGTLETIVWLLLGAIVVTVLYRVGHTFVEYAIGVVEWVRHQIQEAFWRDAGKLTTELNDPSFYIRTPVHSGHTMIFAAYRRPGLHPPYRLPPSPPDLVRLASRATAQPSSQSQG